MRKFEEADWKYCPRCKCIYPIDFFYNDKSTYDKLGIYCKSCDYEKRKRHYDNHPLSNTFGVRKFRNQHPFHRKLYIEKKISNGICRQCNSRSINFSRSVGKCNICLDGAIKYKRNKRYEEKICRTLF